MPRSKKSVVKKDPAAVAVQQILSLFGPPPLLSTENREHFKRILAHVVSEVAPAGAIVQMWVYDIAVLVWEMMRLRRYKAMLIKQSLADALAESNLTTDFIHAQAFLQSRAEEIEPMLVSIQARRDAIIREIGAYRDSLARRVKKAIDDIIEVPAEDVEITPRLAAPARKKSTAA